MYFIARRPCGKIAGILESDVFETSQEVSQEYWDFLICAEQQGGYAHACRNLQHSSPTGGKRDRWQCRRHELAECACRGVEHGAVSPYKAISGDHSVGWLHAPKNRSQGILGGLGYD